METQAASPWGMVIGIIIGVGTAFLIVWGAWKLSPYVYNMIFPPKEEGDNDRMSG